MNENEMKRIVWVFCPLLHDTVRVDRVCQKCPDWNGVRCGYRTPTRQKASRPSYPSRPPRPPVGGGVRVPPVWEKWPRPDSSQEPLYGAGTEQNRPDYGVAGSLAGHKEYVPKDKDDEEEDFDKPRPLEGETSGQPDVEITTDVDVPSLPGEPEPSPESVVPDPLENPVDDPMESPVSKPVDDRGDNPMAEPFPQLPQVLPEGESPLDSRPESPLPDGPPDGPQLPGPLSGPVPGSGGLP